MWPTTTWKKDLKRKNGLLYDCDFTTLFFYCIYRTLWSLLIFWIVFWGFDCVYCAVLALHLSFGYLIKHYFFGKTVSVLVYLVKLWFMVERSHEWALQQSALILFQTIFSDVGLIFMHSQWVLHLKLALAGKKCDSQTSALIHHM